MLSQLFSTLTNQQNQNSHEKKLIRFSTPFSNYVIEKTKDGSETLYSEHFQEYCHSSAGAYEETQYYYVEGTGVLEAVKAGKDEIIVGEIGFGSGLGLSCTLDEIGKILVKEQKEGSSKRKLNLHFVSFEIDEELARMSVKNLGLIPDGFDKFEEEAIGNHEKILILKTNIKAMNISLSLDIICGDAAKIFENDYLPKRFLGLFEHFYQDAFSPKQNPSLWSEKWFSFLTKYCHENVVLGTFSAAGIAKRGLQNSGWQVSKIPGYGKKREALRATRFLS